MAILNRSRLGGVRLYEVDADPDGSLAAPKGSFALDSVNGVAYVNTNGSTAWMALGAGGGGYVYGVSARHIGSWYPGSISNGPLAGSGNYSNWLCASKLIVPNTTTLSGLAINVTSAGGAGVYCYLALYRATSNTDLTPNERVAATGQILCDVTGIRGKEDFSVALTPGVYWRAVVWPESQTSLPTTTWVPVWAALPILGLGAAGLVTDPYCCWSKTWVTGPPPDPFPSSPDMYYGAFPSVYAKFSA